MKKYLFPGIKIYKTLDNNIPTKEYYIQSLYEMAADGLVPIDESWERMGFWNRLKMRLQAFRDPIYFMQVTIAVHSRELMNEVFDRVNSHQKKHIIEED